MICLWLTLGLTLGLGLGLILAATPFIYYLIAIFSAWRYFRQPRPPINRSFTPPVSNLKPIRGLDLDAYDNLASFCRQDYPDYELLLCVDPSDDAVHSVIERLRRDFPERTRANRRDSGLRRGDCRAGRFQSHGSHQFHSDWPNRS